MDNGYNGADGGGILQGLLNLFGGPHGAQPAAAGAPMDIRPAGLQQTMAQPAQQGGGTYNAMGDIGMRLMAAGQPMTSAQRSQMVGAIPGAVAANNYADQMRQQMMNPQHPVVGLLGNGAPMTPEQAQGNNSVWANLGRGMNSDGSMNPNSGFGGGSNFDPRQQLQQRYGMY
jgi:hypothetical protein